MIGRRLGAVLLAFAAMVAWSPALAQQLGQGGGNDVPWWRVIGAFLVCIALAVGGAFALKSRFRGPVIPGFGQARRRLQLIDTLRLSHQVDICLFKCDDTDFLVAATPHGAIVLNALNSGSRSAQVE